MTKSKEGSTRKLLELCGGYFLFYVVYTVATKYLTGPAASGLPAVKQLEYLIFSTIGGSLICLLVILFFRWGKMESARTIQWGKFYFPSEFLYIIPSGICTAIVVPSTTLLYTLLRSVMVAMLIMRGSVIVLSRLVDAIQIRAGIFRKKVYKEEDMAVVFAIMAVCVQLFFVKNKGGDDLFHNFAAMLVLGSYLLSYFIRIYIMNYYKNTRDKCARQNNKAFFAIEPVTFPAAVLPGARQLLAWRDPGGNGLRHRSFLFSVHFHVQGAQRDFRGLVQPPHFIGGRDNGHPAVRHFFQRQLSPAPGLAQPGFYPHRGSVHDPGRNQTGGRAEKRKQRLPGRRLRKIWF
jgi:hypothetical protein